MIYCSNRVEFKEFFRILYKYIFFLRSIQLINFIVIYIKFLLYYTGFTKSNAIANVPD